jgi:hypothetical protein
LRKFFWLATVFAIFLLGNLASAQQADAMLGFGTILASGTNNNNGCIPTFNHSCVGEEKGGLFTTISGDVIFRHRIGFNVEGSWRTKQGLDQSGQFYRPILFDFNGDYQPRFGKKIGADLLGGIGFQDTRFYAFNFSSSCVNFGSCFTSDNHFLVHVGGGLRYYVYGHAFIRPEVHYYHIVNNTDVYTNSNIIRVGASIGYTIGGPE